MTDRELMQQALDALEEAADHVYCPGDDDAIGVARKALRARLAQPEQSQIVWIDNKQTGNFLNMAPPQREWQGLTDDEIVEIAATPAAIPGAYVHCFARDIEAKLKEKNT